MEALLNNILTTDVMVTALLVAGILEAAKQALKASTAVDLGTPVVKTIMAILPIPLGALIGHLTVSAEAVAPSWAMGMVAGILSSQFYNVLSPAIKKATERRGES